MERSDIRGRLAAGNARWQALEGETAARRRETAEEGQRPYAIVIACSDSRVIPEQIFGAGLGELFVVRVAGNVLDRHQLGSVEYAAAHLHCRMILMLGHTGCGAVGAALSGGGEVKPSVSGASGAVDTCMKEMVSWILLRAVISPAWIWRAPTRMSSVMEYPLRIVRRHSPRYAILPSMRRAYFSIRKRPCSLPKFFHSQLSKE